MGKSNLFVPSHVCMRVTPVLSMTPLNWEYDATDQPSPRLQHADVLATQQLTRGWHEFPQTIAEVLVVFHTMIHLQVVCNEFFLAILQTVVH